MTKIAAYRNTPLPLVWKSQPVVDPVSGPHIGWDPSAFRKYDGFAGGIRSVSGVFRQAISKSAGKTVLDAAARHDFEPLNVYANMMSDANPLSASYNHPDLSALLNTFAKRCCEDEDMIVSFDRWIRWNKDGSDSMFNTILHEAETDVHASRLVVALCRRDNPYVLSAAAYRFIDGGTFIHDPHVDAVGMQKIYREKKELEKTEDALLRQFVGRMDHSGEEDEIAALVMTSLATNPLKTARSYMLAVYHDDIFFKQLGVRESDLSFAILNGSNEETLCDAFKTLLPYIHEDSLALGFILRFRHLNFYEAYDKVFKEQILPHIDERAFMLLLQRYPSAFIDVRNLAAEGCTAAHEAFKNIEPHMCPHEIFVQELALGGNEEAQKLLEDAKNAREPALLLKLFADFTPPDTKDK